LLHRLCVTRKALGALAAAVIFLGSALTHFEGEHLSRVGYFEGIDPLLLATLAAEGIETLPIANTWDGHGKAVNHLAKGEVDVVVGHLHKVIPAEQGRTAMFELMLNNMLVACKTHNIPVLLIVPSKMREKAKKLLGDVGANVHIVSPEETEAQIRKYL